MDEDIYTPQSIVDIMNVKINESSEDKKPQLVECLLIKTRNVQLDKSPISISCVKLISGSMQPTNMQIINLEYNSKTLVFNDNVVMQHSNGVIVYNLSKDRQLEIEF